MCVPCLLLAALALVPGLDVRAQSLEIHTPVGAVVFKGERVDTTDKHRQLHETLP